jgi:protein-L-isoaspartate(D-aspartate) O-methyltransferase
MLPERSDDIGPARRWFAEELRHTANVRSPAVAEAFGTVPREHFAGPGPWRVLSPMRGRDYWTTDDADPRRLCHDILVAIDETRRLNNGQPSPWASLIDQLGLTLGERVVHVGAGLGYYSAIMAEIVGSGGRVTAIEIDPVLAERARANLSRAWRQANVVAADGFALGRKSRSTPSSSTPASRTFRPAGSLARCGERAASGSPDQRQPVGRVPYHRAPRLALSGPLRLAHRHHPVIGGRNADAEARLAVALATADFTEVKSLRRPPEEPDDACWLKGEGWWRSTAEADEGHGRAGGG